MRKILSPSGKEYGVGKILREQATQNVYECFLPDGRMCFLKIVSDSDYNDLFDREAFVLRKLTADAVRLEEEYAGIKDDPNEYLNYQFGFPRLEESFVCESQEGRRVNIVSTFEIADRLSDLAPLGRLLSKEGLRIDPRTSGWVLGKLLKGIVFAHSVGVSIKEVNGGNILINCPATVNQTLLAEGEKSPERHLVAVFDWANAVIHRGGVVPELDARLDISRAAMSVITALGGDPNTGHLPEDDQLIDNRYQNFLWELANGGECDASVAHRKHYRLIWSLWGRGFWPTTLHKLK